jgi:anti-sigma factor RsiW
MTCTDFLAQLTEYFDGEVPDGLRAEVEQHLAACKHCEVVLDSTSKTINIYRNHELYDFPAEVQQRLHEAIMSRCAAYKR